MDTQQNIPCRIKGSIAIGSNRWLSWKASWPNAELVVYSDKLLLNLPWSKLNLPKEEIDEILIAKILFGWRIQIIHYNPKYHKYIGFGILKWDQTKLVELIDILRAESYNVINHN